MQALNIHTPFVTVTGMANRPQVVVPKSNAPVFGHAKVLKSAVATRSRKMTGKIGLMIVAHFASTTHVSHSRSFPFLPLSRHHGCG